MTSIRKAKRILALVTAVVAGGLVQAEAATISVVPAAQTANVADVVAADIVVSGLGAAETVGGFSFLLSFDDTILSELAYAIGAGMGAAPDDFTVFGPGSPLDFFVLADITLAEPALKLLQGASFTLATVSFDAIAAGVSALDVSAVVLSNFDGTADIPVTAVADGHVCVGQNCPVGPPIPEPGLLMMLGAGVTAVAAARGRRPGRPTA